jgi:hypothetical protein
MNKQVLNKVVAVALIFVGVLAIAGCVPGELASVAASSIDAIAPADRELADAASVARWNGLGERYSAAAEGERVDADVAAIARWQAIGAYYEARSEGRLTRALATNAARWQAMGEFYAPDAVGDKSALSPDVARWIGLGDTYQELQQAADGK